MATAYSILHSWGTPWIGGIRRHRTSGFSLQHLEVAQKGRDLELKGRRYARMIANLLSCTCIMDHSQAVWAG